jgi:hypothetical protein
MSVIKEIRKIIDNYNKSICLGGTEDKEYLFLQDIFMNYEPEGYEVEHVDSSFSQGGRWTNEVSDVYKIIENGEVAFFELTREVPATELQEGNEFSFWINEVVPQEVTIIKYVPIK